MKVKLLYDFTKYNEALQKGIEGDALETPEEQKIRKPDDFFVRVNFGVTTVDVPWRGLDIIDELYLKKKQDELDLYVSKLKTSKNVKLILGPKGGFKEISFEYLDEGELLTKVINLKEEGEFHKSTFEKLNVSMTVEMLEGKKK